MFCLLVWTFFNFYVLLIKLVELKDLLKTINNKIIERDYLFKSLDVNIDKLPNSYLDDLNSILEIIISIF